MMTRHIALHISKKVVFMLVLVALSFIPVKHLFLAFYSSFGIEAKSYVDYGFLYMTTNIFAMIMMLFLLFFIFLQNQTIRVMEAIERRIGFGFFIALLIVIICLFSWPVRTAFLKRVDGFVECKELRFSGRRMHSRTYAIDDAECRRLVQAKRANL